VAALVAAGTGAVLLSSAALAPTAASAAPTAKTNYKFVSVGSDTIYCVDGGSATGGDAGEGIYAAFTEGSATTTGNTATDVAPAGSINLGCRTTAASQVAPADSVHGAVSFNSTATSQCKSGLSTGQPWLYPFGSSAGIACLTFDAGAGNIAFARSSRGRSSTDPANLEFWAFALDAVSWSHPKENISTKATLTPAQINYIYTCSGTRFWDDPGMPGGALSTHHTPIALYYPQNTSGTGDFFATVYLVGGKANRPMSGTGNACWNTIHFVPENDGTQIAAADKAGAILPYSFAVHTAQASPKHIETNLGSDAVLGGVNGVTPTLTTVSEAAAFTNTLSGQNACNTPKAGAFCGSRYVYHVSWNKAVAGSNPGLPPAYYAAVMGLIGTGPTGVAAANSVCKGADTATIQLFGFKNLTLSKTAEPGAWPGTASGLGSSKSYCRLF
jgi:ABC-type phosphate transport system substrate-binding protein